MNSNLIWHLIPWNFLERINFIDDWNLGYEIYEIMHNHIDRNMKSYFDLVFLNHVYKNSYIFEKNYCI